MTTDIPGIREILTTPDIALVVPPGRTEPLVAALEQLAVNTPERVRLASRGRAHVVEHFSRSRMARQTEAALQLVVEDRLPAQEAGHV